MSQLDVIWSFFDEDRCTNAETGGWRAWGYDCDGTYHEMIFVGNTPKSVGAVIDWACNVCTGGWIRHPLEIGHPLLAL